MATHATSRLLDCCKNMNSTVCQFKRKLSPTLAAQQVRHFHNHRKRLISPEQSPSMLQQKPHQTLGMSTLLTRMLVQDSRETPLSPLKQTTSCPVQTEWAETAIGLALQHLAPIIDPQYHMFSTALAQASPSNTTLTIALSIAASSAMQQQKTLHGMGVII
jgi:hypothetical protein